MPNRNCYLDIFNTVQDPGASVLVEHEYEEWGHVGHSASTDQGIKSKDDRVLEYIRSYSPCENVWRVGEGKRTDMLPQCPLPLPLSSFPRVLVTVGLQDKRVGPWESIHWTTLIRKRLEEVFPSLPANQVILRILESSGHDGPSTLTDEFSEAAAEILFLESSIHSSAEKKFPQI